MGIYDDCIMALSKRAGPGLTPPQCVRRDVVVVLLTPFTISSSPRLSLTKGADQRDPSLTVVPNIAGSSRRNTHKKKTTRGMDT